jgi:rod shape-determining protein MreD
MMPFLQVGNARPDLLLMITVTGGLLFGRAAGVMSGFFSGLLWDLLTAQFFGMYTLAKVITGYIIGNFEKKVFKDNILLPMVAIFFATILHEVILYLSARMMDIQAPFFSLISHTIVPTAIYNCLVMPFVYFAILRFRHMIWLEERHKTEI